LFSGGTVIVRNASTADVCFAVLSVKEVVEFQERKKRSRRVFGGTVGFSSSSAFSQA
jgi:hypothetical protein